MAKIITDEAKIDRLLKRGVSEVIVSDHLRNALLSGKKLRVKLGNDPTSPNIHIGRAIVLRKLREFQELGHTVVFIVGDFTGLIGDTSDKDSERPMLSEVEIKKNIKTYFAQAFKILDKNKTETYYNSKWLSKLGFLELAKLASLFGLHEFESRELIAKRMKAGKRVSFSELIYPLMQGYDSVAVKADVELGGTDQKFNLLAGRTIQSYHKQAPQDILMTELLEGLDGRKMSSSWGNTVNITDAPNEMFGKIMSLNDDLIGKYFFLCTDLKEGAIKEVLSRGPRDAKLELAKAIVSIYHGERSGVKAKEDFISIFAKKEKPEDIKKISLGVNSMTLIDLIYKSELVSSKSEARRLIEQGGVKIDDEKKSDPNEIISLEKEILVQVGPRRFIRIAQ